jgi:hypothetical protein
VFAQAADRPTRFVRVMILPARLKGQSSISYVNAEERDKPKSQRYKVYLDAPIIFEPRVPRKKCRATALTAASEPALKIALQE